jgi:hypothetical protein
MKKYSNWIKIVLSVLFLLCLLNMPYGYYQLVRFIGLICFGLMSYSAFLRNDKFYFIVWLSSAILINPIFKMSLGREIWNIVDVIWAIGLIISLKTEKINKNGVQHQL